MYVRQASTWSTVLYAAAALDDDLDEAGQTAAVAKAYVARCARARSRTARCRSSAASPSPQEHPAHRFLRRIVVREQQFGDAAHHERELGRALAAARPAARSSPATAGPRGLGPLTGDDSGWLTTSGFNDPTAQRLERVTTGADPDVVGPLLADVLHDPRWLGCDVALISGGKSNLTYRVASRRGRGHPPAPAARAHPSHRARHGPRVHASSPRSRARPCRCRATLYLGDADGPLGAPFYVMERVARAHLPQRAPRRLRRRRPSSARAIGEGLVDALAALHTVDPAAVGLAEFGRPAGFMERQLRRWSKQWEATKIAELPALDALRDDLLRDAAAAARARDRARRLPARQHDPAPDAARLGSSPSSTGR